MRPVTALRTLALLSACPLAWTFVVDAKAPARYTLLVQIDNPVPERTLTAIRTELNSVMKSTRWDFELLLFDEMVPNQEFRDLVVVRLKGDCRLGALPARRQEGPLAFAHTSDGQVLPFMDVFCDRIRATIRAVMWGDHYRRPEEIIGRALARVIAHELYHIIGNTSDHAHSGIANHTLSGEQLVCDRFEFDPESLDVITTGAGGG
jgi:hypothetical protein